MRFTKRSLWKLMVPCRALAPDSWESTWSYHKGFCLNNSSSSPSARLFPIVNCRLDWQISCLSFSPFSFFFASVYIFSEPMRLQTCPLYSTLVRAGNCSTCGRSLTSLFRCCNTNLSSFPTCYSAIPVLGCSLWGVLKQGRRKGIAGTFIIFSSISLSNHFWSQVNF